MFCSRCGVQNNNGESFCKNCGVALDNNQPQQFNSINVDEELKRSYIGKNADKIINGHGGSVWLFLFGGSYLIYRKLYLYGFIYLLISMLLLYFKLNSVVVIGRIALCFFFYKIYLSHVDKEINKIRKDNPNAGFEELKEKCKKKGGVSYAAVALAIGITLIVSLASVALTSNKLVCESDQGKITLMYDKKTIIGYTANGYSYDLEGQKKYAEEIGIDAYIKEFAKWFSNNTNGSCK